MEKKTLIIIFIITLLAATLRFYRLGEIPTGLHRDEAFLGYNTYSILKTGKDISGNFLPLHFQSFLYSPAGYSYFSLPFIQLFDLNAFSVRFASAMFGTLTVVVTCILVLALLNNLRLAFLTSFFLAISPWHVNLTRTATENTLVVFFITLGIYLYLRWYQKPNLIKLIFTSVLFVLALTIYQASRAFLPIFLPMMVMTLGYPRNDWRRLGIIYLVVIILPLILILTSAQLSLRIRTVSIFADTGVQLVVDEQIREDGVTGVQRPLTRLFHNKLVGYTNQFIKNYFAHFTYDFLFTDKGFPERYRISNVGLLYLFEVPLLLLGIYRLWQKKRRIAIFIFSWIVIAPIGSALTFDDVPNLQRTLLVFPALPIITAAGATALMDLDFTNKYINALIYLGKFLLLFVAVYNILFYLHQYYVHEPIHKPWFRNEGYQELVSAVNELLPNYKKAIITTRESAPTIFFLFFSKYDPAIFQKETYSPVPRDLDRINYAKYEFSQNECPLRLDAEVDPVTGVITKQFTGTSSILYVNFGTCETPTNLANELVRITRGDKSAVFKIVITR